MPDIGERVVQDIFQQLNIDEKWSRPLSRRFEWWVPGLSSEFGRPQVLMIMALKFFVFLSSLMPFEKLQHQILWSRRHWDPWA